jgi:PTS system fructose-specific IIC component
MIASVIAAIGGVGDRVAHGGPIVAVLGGIDHILWFILAVIVGSLVTMITVLILKRRTPVIAVDVLISNNDSLLIKHMRRFIEM